LKTISYNREFVTERNRIETSDNHEQSTYDILLTCVQW